MSKKTFDDPRWYDPLLDRLFDLMARHVGSLHPDDRSK